jgi:PIN domain nuclease of toxin-antitoxin system
MKAEKGRLAFDRDIRVWVTQALAHPRLALVPLTSDIAVSAGLLGADGFHGDPADRLIVATALHHGVVVVTKDRAIHDFARVRAVW